MKDQLLSGRGYPRPQLRRADWSWLGGTWACAIDAPGHWTVPSEVEWDRQIVVPFSPEAPLSGIGETGFFRAVWYSRQLVPPSLRDGERWILHFGAVDYAATVWINDRIAGNHEGGSTPFSIDLTPFVGLELEPITVCVRAFDDPQDLEKPRGK